jgi:hypothetical protein
MLLDPEAWIRKAERQANSACKLLHIQQPQPTFIPQWRAEGNRYRRMR